MRLAPVRQTIRVRSRFIVDVRSRFIVDTVAPALDIGGDEVGDRQLPGTIRSSFLESP